MSFFLWKLLAALLAPLGSALLAGAVGLVLGWQGYGRWAWRLGVVAVVWLGFWSLPLTSQGLRGRLEADFPYRAPTELPVADAIVVLGGSMIPPRRDHPVPDLGGAADRVWYAAQLYHAGKARWLVLSGGSDGGVSLASEADSMRVLLRDLGVPDTAMLLEPESRNTRENARFSAELLRSRGFGKVLLVTSALHMRRALRLFRAEGLAVIPAATDHEATSLDGWLLFLPDAAALMASGWAMKEWADAIFHCAIETWAANGSDHHRE